MCVCVHSQVLALANIIIVHLIVKYVCFLSSNFPKALMKLAWTDDPEKTKKTCCLQWHLPLAQSLRSSAKHLSIFKPEVQRLTSVRCSRKAEVISCDYFKLCKHFDSEIILPALSGSHTSFDITQNSCFTRKHSLWNDFHTVRNRFRSPVAHWGTSASRIHHTDATERRLNSLCSGSFVFIVRLYHSYYLNLNLSIT